MKTINLKLFAVLLTIMACTPDANNQEINFTPYDYTGTWDLSSLSITSISINSPQTENFREDLPADENCLQRSNFVINDDNTAVLTLTSSVNASIELDTTNNTIEQIVNCDNVGSIRTFTWEKATNMYVFPVGPTIPVSSFIETIKFFDENNELAFIGEIHQGDVLYIVSCNSDRVSIEVEDEIFSYITSSYLFFYK